jgi:hypothetical protein
VMNAPSRPMRSAPTAPTRLGAATPGGAKLDHAPVAVAARTGQSSLVKMMPGLIVLIPAPRFPKRTASAITRSQFPRLASW